MNKPEINVTPLIDVLLVLLIIFMVVTPIKPSALDARVPSEPINDGAYPNPNTLVLAIAVDGFLRLNNVEGLGTMDEPEPIKEKLRQVFAERVRNVGKNGAKRAVFIKAPQKFSYGTVVKVVDAAKEAGADPIALQIDDLE
jgi:biopolymer transport protein ExbD